MVSLIISQMIQVQRDMLYKKRHQRGHQLTTRAEKHPSHKQAPARVSSKTVGHSSRAFWRALRRNSHAEQNILYRQKRASNSIDSGLPAKGAKQAQLLGILFLMSTKCRTYTAPSQKALAKFKEYSQQPINPGAI